jgi:hypothetical protein
VHQLRTLTDHGAHALEFARLNGGHEAADGNAIDKSLELGPTLEAVGAGEDELRVAESDVAPDIEPW